MELSSTLPARLTERMDELEITATELAAQVGISKQAISSYCTGVRSPKKPTVESLSRALKVNPLWLLGYDVSKEVDYLHMKSGAAHIKVCTFVCTSLYASAS